MKTLRIKTSYMQYYPDTQSKH